MFENAGSAPPREFELILKIKFCSDCFTSLYLSSSFFIKGASKVSTELNATAVAIPPFSGYLLYLNVDGLDYLFINVLKTPAKC